MGRWHTAQRKFGCCSGPPESSGDVHAHDFQRDVRAQPEEGAPLAKMPHIRTNPVPSMNSSHKRPVPRSVHNATNKVTVIPDPQMQGRHVGLFQNEIVTSVPADRLPVAGVDRHGVSSHPRAGMLRTSYLCANQPRTHSLENIGPGHQSDSAPASGPPPIT